VVAQPLRRPETLAIFWFSGGPFAARGATGEAEYPTRWLGGTGEPFAVGKQERGGACGQPFEDEQKGNGTFVELKIRCCMIYHLNKSACVWVELLS
jgi:hypothetical protein